MITTGCCVLAVNERCCGHEAGEMTCEEFQLDAGNISSLSADQGKCCDDDDDGTDDIVSLVHSGPVLRSACSSLMALFTTASLAWLCDAVILLLQEGCDGSSVTAPSSAQLPAQNTRLLQEGSEPPSTKGLILIFIQFFQYSLSSWLSCGNQ